MLEGRSSDVMSVLAVLAGFVLAMGLAIAAFLTGFCALFGAQCTSTELQQIQVLQAASLGVFLVVPVAVAIVRGQARWLLAPVVEAALLASIVIAFDWF